MSRALITAFGLGCCLSAPGMAGEIPADAVQVAEREPATAFTAGFGYLQARAHELVYGGASPEGELSRLIWDTEHALLAHIGLRHTVEPRLDLFVDFSTALADQGHLVDYDWLGSGAEWTDRSRHPDTGLDHYFHLDAGADWSLLDWGGLSLSARGGFRLVDVSWTARGGDYVYSSAPDEGGFRDERGTFPAGEAGISYRQKLPGLYLGPQATWETGRLTWRAGALAGLTLGPSDRDHHWDRNLLFVEDFDSRGFFEVSLGVSYALHDTAELYLEGIHERYQLMKGSIWQRDTATGATEFYGGDSAGARFESWQFRTGIEIRF